ncbi:hypothetical protein Fot_06486 [Forsythia ovata]|uniref:Uncharacterized protein n=1 Tax=Forsythia ovata TaxID=205694 RepID=A0ABD1WT45_9LAMI
MESVNVNMQEIEEGQKGHIRSDKIVLQHHISLYQNIFQLQNAAIKFLLGINYGQIANKLLTSTVVVPLVKSIDATGEIHRCHQDQALQKESKLHISCRKPNKEPDYKSRNSPPP